MKYSELTAIFCILYIFAISLCFANQTDEMLSQLETSTFSKTFANEDYETRLNRLENNIFGATQRGRIEERLSKIIESSSYNCYEAPQEYTSIISSNKGLKGFWNKIKSEYTNGTVTGFTPSLYDSYDFGNNFPYNQFNSTLPKYRFNMNDYNNYYTPFDRSNLNPFRNKYINPISNIKYGNNYYGNRNYRKHRVPQLLNTGAFGGTKVTIIKD